VREAREAPAGTRAADKQKLLAEIKWS
jgi:hypothetical protein